MDRGAGDKGEQETKGYLFKSLKTMTIMMTLTTTFRKQTTRITITTIIAKNHSTRTLKLFCDESGLKKHQIFEK